MLKLTIFCCLILQASLLGQDTTIDATVEGGDPVSAQVTIIIDSDRDGLTDAQEDPGGDGVGIGETDPFNPDTDGDGVLDGVELDDPERDPLFNEAVADPDYFPLIAAGVTGSLEAFFDFENFDSNRFSSRSGSGALEGRGVGVSNIWIEDDGRFGRSASVGQGRYLEGLEDDLDEGPGDLWVTKNKKVEKWVMSLSFKLNQLPSFDGQEVPMVAVLNTDFNTTLYTHPSRFVFFLKRVSSNELRFVIRNLINPSSAYSLKGEWRVPSHIDLTQWTDLVFASKAGDGNSGLTKSDSRILHINGEFVSTVEVGDEKYGNFFDSQIGGKGHFLIGAYRPNSTQTIDSPISFQVDRFATFNEYSNDIVDAMRNLGRYDTTDSDEDGLTDFEEDEGKAEFSYANGDVREVMFGLTEKEDFDSDDDFFDDYWEAKYFDEGADPNHGRVSPKNGSFPTKVDDAATTSFDESDYDNDGLPNFDEMRIGTDPNEEDTDKDGVSDFDEYRSGVDPLDDGVIPFDPTAFYGDLDLDPNCEPMGALGLLLDGAPPGSEADNIIRVDVGDDSASHSERWQLQFGELGQKVVSAGDFGQLSGFQWVTLDPLKNHEVILKWLGSNRENPDLDYDAVVDTGKSVFLLCDPDGVLGRGSTCVEHNAGNAQCNVDLAELAEKPVWLVPLSGNTTSSLSLSFSGGDAVGPRYRKVGLNGRPLSDEKPEQEEETDLPSEESYIDAFNRTLHHDNSIIYVPLAASDLKLQVSMSSAETIYNDRSSLLPHERVDLPFGPGWSSNMASYIEVAEVLGSHTDDPIAVNVVDEAGRSQRFATTDLESFSPWPSARVDKKTYLNKLTKVGEKLVLKKKFGNTLIYEPCKAWFMYHTDRLEGSTSVRKHRYWRLKEVRDRFGVSLQYNYGGHDASLLPLSIDSPERPGQGLAFKLSSDCRRVEEVTDSRFNTYVFNYDSSVPSGELTAPTLSSIGYPDGSDTSYVYDTPPVDEEIDDSGSEVRVTKHFHINIGSITDKRANTHTFAYEFDRSQEYWQASIPGGSGQVPTAGFDGLPAEIEACVKAEIGKNASTADEPTGDWETVYGVPRQVVSVTLPGNFGQSVFTSTGRVRYAEEVTIAEPTTTVTDAEQNQTHYTFTGVSAEVVDVDLSPTSVSKEWMIYYTTSTIHLGGLGSGLGTETYNFDLESGLSLGSMTDFSGNYCSWIYDATPFDGERLPLGNGNLLVTWSDPLSKTDALNRVESYTYGSEYRIMDTVNDVYGTVSDYDVDFLGRRKIKSVSEAGSLGELYRETFDYLNPKQKGFLTHQTVEASGGASDPDWVVDLVTEYVPDSNGRILREIMDPAGENLEVTHGYDFNNNKIRTTDARGNLTRFVYDELNRLTEVIYPRAQTSSGLTLATKRILYNKNGSKAAEIDEEGNYTIFHYDALNRLTKTIRDMDGLELPQVGNGLVSETGRGSAGEVDLVTSYRYNAVNSMTHIIDSEGNLTRTFYDVIQRPRRIFTGLSAASHMTTSEAGLVGFAAGSSSITDTQLFYDTGNISFPGSGVTMKGNTGSSGFNSSGFKPTRIVRHNVVLTASSTTSSTLTSYHAYDAVYRPLRTEAEYELGQYAVTTYSYDSINGSTRKEGLTSTMTDTLNKVTQTTKDGLHRVTEVIDDFGGLNATSSTEYTSTGLAWKATDAEDRETEREYDGVGRLTDLWQPDPITGVVNRSTPNNPLLGSPHTETIYDKNSNVIATINPLGNRWDYDFDARNRQIEEEHPAVTKSEIINGIFTQAFGQQPSTNIVFDGAGNVLSVRNARGHTTRIFYDQAYRVTDVLTNPVTGNPSSDLENLNASDIRVQSEYDLNSNVIAVTDGNGNITKNQYDVLNRLVATATNPSDGQPNAPPLAPKSTDIVVTNSYDDAGSLVKVVDGEGHVTGYRFDGFGRKTRTLWDEGKAEEEEEQCTFDGLVKLTRVDGESRLTTYQYDGLNRLENILYTGRSADNRLNAYDLVGNLTSVTYPNESNANRTIRNVVHSHDKLNRVVSETSAGVAHIYTYDKAGNRKSTTYGTTLRFLGCEYDALNRLTSCLEKSSPTSKDKGLLTRYFYDLSSNITRKTLPNNSYTDCVFDALNRKLSKNSYRSNDALIVSFDYSQPQNGYPSGYDKVGNVLSIDEDYGDVNMPSRVVSNTYDHAHRLVQETFLPNGGSIRVTDFGYDEANNRTSKSVVEGSEVTEDWTLNYGNGSNGFNANQLSQAVDSANGKTVSFTYDGSGNRATKLVNDKQIEIYFDDYENRYTEVINKNKGSFEYQYDHRTRRVGRDESSAGGNSDRVSFSGGASVQEYTSGSSSPSVQYIRGSDYGGGIGGILYTRRDGIRLFNHYNSRGDVVSQTDGYSSIKWQAAYEAFGTRTEEEGTNNERQKANTKDEDAWGALNEGMRYRDLEFGVFLTRDPAGFVDGPNVYTYVTQNPWTYWDALGLQKGRRGWKNPSAARWKANGGWKGAAAGAWAGLSRGAVDSYSFVALNSPGLLFEAGVAKLTGQESVRSQEKAKAEAYKQEISESVAYLTETDANSANFKGGQTGGEILTPGIPALKGGQLAARTLSKVDNVADKVDIMNPQSLVGKTQRQINEELQEQGFTPKKYTGTSDATEMIKDTPSGRASVVVNNGGGRHKAPYIKVQTGTNEKANYKLVDKKYPRGDIEKQPKVEHLDMDDGSVIQEAN